jgi:hypothetical protein
VLFGNAINANNGQCHVIEEALIQAMQLVRLPAKRGWGFEEWDYRAHRIGWLKTLCREFERVSQELDTDGVPLHEDEDPRRNAARGGVDSRRADARPGRSAARADGGGSRQSGTNMAKKNLNDESTAMRRYIAEVDRFATILNAQQAEIERLERDVAIAKADYERRKESLREAKDYEHGTITLLLKFIRPGSIDIMPLFDTMEPADEEVQGKNATEWRKEPITSLNLSALAMRTLMAADIVLVGQLQDRILKGSNWHEGLEGINDGMSQAIEMKLNQFIEENTK